MNLGNSTRMGALVGTFVIVLAILQACGEDEGEGASAGDLVAEARLETPAVTNDEPTGSEVQVPKGTDTSTAIAESDAAPVSEPAVQTFEEPAPNALIVEDLIVGSGPKADQDSWVLLRTETHRLDGTLSTQSMTLDKPIEIFLGQRMIPAWNEGLIGIRAGGVRRVIAGAEMGYRDRPPSKSPLRPFEPVVITFHCEQVFPDPIANLPSGMRITRKSQGSGPAAAYGDFIKFHVIAYGGNDMRTLLHTRDPDQQVFEIGLPSPPGMPAPIMLEPNIPYLNHTLLGMRKGEVRELFLPASKAFRDQGNRLLGVRGGEDVIFEITCEEITPATGHTLANGVTYEILEEGEGDFIWPVHWVGLRIHGESMDGQLIESNLDERAEPYLTRFPDRPLLLGVRYGMGAMREGEKRRISFPNREFGLMEHQADQLGIDMDADLVFTVEVVETYGFNKPGK